MRIDENKKGTETMRCGLPSGDKPLPSLTSQKGENNGHMSGTVLDTFHNPPLLPETATRKVLFPASPGQRQNLEVSRELTASQWSGQLGQAPGSNHPVDPRALVPAVLAGRPMILAQGFCAEAQALFRAVYSNTI